MSELAKSSSPRPSLVKIAFRAAWFQSLLVALVVMALSCPGVAQTSSSISGTVKSSDGQPLPGATVTVVGQTLTRDTVTNANGRYRIPALPAEDYDITVSVDGFSTESLPDFHLPINSNRVLDFNMKVGEITETVTVSAEFVPLLDTTTSDTGSIVTPDQIETLPVNGRDYLDLMQLVPGVQLNREKDRGSDEAAPILGERAGNAIFLLDGMPNRDEFGSGVGSQFNQDAIQEFEVITGGFKAEYGHGSGGVINALTKSGTNEVHGLALAFVRNDSLDSSNSLEEGNNDAPDLSRENFAFNMGGPIVKDSVFVFGSAELIDEDRELDFAFPAATPAALRQFERQFDLPNTTKENRYFLKFTEHLGPSHSFHQQISYNDAEIGDFLPLSAAGSLPSTRNDSDLDRTMFGLRQTSLFGGDNPLIFEAYLQYRDHSDVERPAHPEAGPLTAFQIFSSPFTGQLFGDVGAIQFGNSRGASEFDSEYIAAGPSINQLVGNHEIKAGIDYLSTKVEGNELSISTNQLFATIENFERYGPVYSGVFTLTEIGARTPEGDRIDLDNDYLGLYVQDDWRIGENLTLNLGVRMDRDSEFEEENLAPRLGFAWTPTPTTVVSGSLGRYYDRFRLGLVRNVPEFGGADMRLIQDLSYPQGFFNLTSIVPVAVGVCVNPFVTQAQADGTPCPFGLPGPHWGVDYLNNLVAPGRSPIPLGTVITEDTIFDLSGLTPEEYVARVNATVPLLGFGGSWYWGPFGALTHTLLADSVFPVTVDPSFETPYTDAFHLGVQQQIGRNHVVSLDIHHKEIENILGVRETNLAFISRIPGNERTYTDGGANGVRGFGPWFEGEYDAVTLGYTKRMSDRFTMSAHYTYTDAVDNLQSSNLGNGALQGSGATTGGPNDSFVGIVPEVTDPTTGQNNRNGSFTAGNGNFIPQAGTFHNGPDLDKGPSPLAVDDQFTLFGLVELGAGFQVSAIFRYQSGINFSSTADQLFDPDGNVSFGSRDIREPKNSHTGPSFKNLDLRVSKRFPFSSRMSGTLLVEFFNVTNEQNAAAIETNPNRPTPFGQALQVLPGREGQIGFRLEF